jgi:glutamate/tyrosine decarboxylase-like PLP-dependent enzyme
VSEERARNLQEFALLFPPLRDAILSYRREVDFGRALPTKSTEDISAELARGFSFATAMPAEEVIDRVASLLREGAVHTPSPSYFGLFNPDVQPICVAADALVAAFNPQLAAFSHNPAANTMERHALSVFTAALGWEDAHATFTSGGSEANHSAVIAALTGSNPGYSEHGACGTEVFYVSVEAHHSFIKIAHACGIGRKSVRQVPVTNDLRMDVVALEAAIRDDIAAGLKPFAVVATAGTTAAGVIDPIPEIAQVCDRAGIWLHVDAAWGGGALLSRRLRPNLDGIERADSVTIDAHKWFSVPMGAGMFFCRHRDVVHQAFGIQTSYMPAPVGTPDPYLSTMQWSRRFIGLKFFMALANLGLDGYERVIDHQAEMGTYLRSELLRSGYEVVNETPFPLVCFRVPGFDAQTIVDRVYQDGSAWISRTVLSHHGEVLRACITNHRTQSEHIDGLVALLGLVSKT